MQVVAVCLVHTKNILSCGTVQSSRYALTFQSICHLHHQDDGGGRFLSDVTYLPADSGWTKVMSNIIITTREPHISIYVTLNKSLISRPKSDWYEVVNSDI